MPAPPPNGAALHRRRHCHHLPEPTAFPLQLPCEQTPLRFLPSSLFHPVRPIDALDLADSGRCSLSCRLVPALAGIALPHAPSSIEPCPRIVTCSPLPDRALASTSPLPAAATSLAEPLACFLPARGCSRSPPTFARAPAPSASQQHRSTAPAHAPLAARAPFCYLRLHLSCRAAPSSRRGWGSFCWPARRWWRPAAVPLASPSGDRSASPASFAAAPLGVRPIGPCPKPVARTRYVPWANDMWGVAPTTLFIKKELQK
nr:uncharacterized protein LOC109735277 [Aegilops tauschii subsp. strangulata]